MTIRFLDTYGSSRTIDTRDYVTRIKEIPGVVWIQPNDTAVTFNATSRTASALATMSGGAGFVQGDDTKRPLYQPGRLNGQSGLVFDGVNDFLLGDPSLWTKGVPWTVAMLYIPAASVSFGAMLSSFDSGAVHSSFLQSNDTVIAQHGNNGRVLPAARGQPHLVVMSSDTAALYTRIDGTSYDPVATNNAVASAAPILGATNTNGGSIGGLTLLDLWIIPRECFLQAPAAIGLIEEYCAHKNVYGLSLDPLAA